MLIYPNSTISSTTIQGKNPILPNFSLKQVRYHSCSGKHRINFKRNLVIAQNPAMQQKITIPNKRGEKLVGVLHEAGSKELVLLCHGFRSSKEHSNMVNLAAALEKEGISAFRFDFSGNGQDRLVDELLDGCYQIYATDSVKLDHAGPNMTTESEGSFEYGNYFSEVEDLRSVVDYFTGANRPTVVVVGHSKGGNVVLLYGSKYHDIPAVVNLSGRYDLKRGIEERLGKNFLERLKKDGYIEVKTKTGEVDYKVTEKSMMERLNTNMHEACLSIDQNCRVWTVHGTADDIIPVDDAKEFDKIIPNHTLRIIEGADHVYSSHQDELASVVLPFIKECVKHAQDVSK